MKKYNFTAIDLFSGVGGLTLGLKNAGFKVVSAVEVEKNAIATYRSNHPEVKLIDRDIRQVSGEDLFKAARVKKIDIIAGCPPCQGFSKLTDKNHKFDPRNTLVLEMARIIEEIKPRMVMLENVPGLNRKGKGSPLLHEFEKRLEKMGYLITKDVLQLADYGVPQSRRRLVLLAGRGFRVKLPSRTHVRSPEKTSSLSSWEPVKKVLMNIEEPVSISFARTNGGPEKFKWHVVRDLSPVNKERFKYLTPGGSRQELPMELRPNCHKNSSGFNNVYGRMSGDDVSPTITSGCTTLSAGRFGHPYKDRTISVREAALIQTFPIDYKIKADTMQKACELFGNALPCKFAKIVSLECMGALLKNA